MDIKELFLHFEEFIVKHNFNENNLIVEKEGATLFMEHLINQLASEEKKICYLHRLDSFHIRKIQGINTGV